MLPNVSTQDKPLVCPKLQHNTKRWFSTRINTTDTPRSPQHNTNLWFNAVQTFGRSKLQRLLQTATQHKPLVNPNVQHNTDLWFSLKLNTTLWSALSLNTTLWSASNFNPAQTFGSFQALKQHKPLVCSIFSTHYNHLVRTILQQKHKHLVRLKFQNTT